MFLISSTTLKPFRFNFISSRSNQLVKQEYVEIKKSFFPNGGRALFSKEVSSALLIQPSWVRIWQFHKNWTQNQSFSENRTLLNCFGDSALRKIFHKVLFQDAYTSDTKRSKHCPIQVRLWANVALQCLKRNILVAISDYVLNHFL